MSNAKDMTQGNPFKLIITFALPLLIGNFFQQLYNVVDTLVVGRYVGVSALAGVGAAGSSIFIIQGFLLGMTNGFAIPIAHSFGAGNYDKMRKYAAADIVLCIGVTIFFSIAMQFLLKPLLKVMNTPEDIIDISYTYARIIYAGIIFTIAYNLFAGMLRALGNSIMPLVFLIVSSLINVISSILFTGFMKMGVIGVALGTIIAQFVSAVLCFLYIQKKQPLLHLRREDFSFTFTEIKTMLRIGIPIGLQACITSLGSIFLQSAINSLGKIYIASFTTANKVENMISTTIPSIGAALSTFTGQNLGAKQYSRIKTGVFYTTLVVAAIAALGAIIMLPFGKSIAIGFVTSSEMEVVNNAYFYIVILTLFLFPLGLLSVFRSVLQGLGHGFAPMMSGVCELVVRCAVAFYFVKLFGYTAVCMAGPLAWLLALVPLFFTYRYRMHRLLSYNGIEYEG